MGNRILASNHFALQTAKTLMKRGYTVVEVVVVFAILAAIIGLAFPAIQMARETARKTRCQNNLRQTAIAVQTHCTVNRNIPTGGWGRDYIGDSSKGIGVDQPGGWVFNLLPFLDRRNLYELSTAPTISEARKNRKSMIQVPLEIFICTSRRQSSLYDIGRNHEFRNCGLVEMAAKSDYAINERLSFTRSELGLEAVDAGLSNVILMGEKSLKPLDFGVQPADRDSILSGNAQHISITPLGFPVPDSATESGHGFGSPHTRGCNFSMCDGSVVPISFTVDQKIFETNGNPGFSK